MTSLNTKLKILGQSVLKLLIAFNVTVTLTFGLGTSKSIRVIYHHTKLEEVRSMSSQVTDQTSVSMTFDLETSISIGVIY